MIVFEYDALDRPVAQCDTSLSGDKIAEWVHDADGQKGYLDASKSCESDVLRVTVDPLV